MDEIETDVALDRLLDRAWTEIAAAGWNRYQLHGRGALLASFEMLKGQSSGMDYITLSSDTRLPDWLDTSIKSYDPETSIVLVFVADDVFRKATARQPGPTLVEERVGVLRGAAYVRTIERTPSPRQCAKSRAN